MKNKNWQNLTAYDLIEEYDNLSDSIKKKYANHAYTKFLRLVEEYGTLGAAYTTGPASWMRQRSVGLTTVMFGIDVINDLVGRDVLPALTSVKQIRALGEFMGYQRIHAVLQFVDRMEQDTKTPKEDKK